jgi:hypothetical protein
MVKLLCLGCVVAAVAAALVRGAQAGESVPSAEPAPPAQAGEAGARSPEAPGGRSAAEVIAQLLSARSSLARTEAEFSWVIGPLGAAQRRFEGRLFLVDANRYRVQFGVAGVVGGGERVLLVPDGRWAYEFGNVPGSIGMRVDLAYMKKEVRAPAARVGHDPSGGVLLELLRERGYVTYEGDEDLDVGRCAVLSYEGHSFRASSPSGPQTPTDAAVARTRLVYRYGDGLLVGEEELDARGRPLSTYRLLGVRHFEPTPDLFEVPASIHCVDVTKQLVRRSLYGPPRPVPGALAR